jgi:hypothetical protein
LHAVLRKKTDISKNTTVKYSIFFYKKNGEFQISKELSNNKKNARKIQRAKKTYKRDNNF